MAGYVMNGVQMRSTAIKYTLSLARQLGRAVPQLPGR